MKKTMIILGMITVLTGCSMADIRYEETIPAAAEADIEPKKMKFEEKESLVEPGYVDISIDCGESRLGAYHVEFHYNPEVIAVSDIERAPEAGFAGTPMAKPESYRSGSTRIIGLAPGGTARTGRIAIARVRFVPVAPGKSKLSVSIRSLYDPDSKPVTGVAILSSDEIVVGQ